MPRTTCPACFRPVAYCYCSRIEKVSNVWPVFILQDVRESRHPIGTARIAALSLGHAEMITLDPDQPGPAADLLHGAFSRPLRDAALIYPVENALPSSALPHCEPAAQAPRDLLFIDASWGRSLRMLKVFPQLSLLPAYALTGLPVSRYRIRKQPTTDAVSTLEAIVHTLDLLEPDVDFSGLLRTMDWVVDQQIKRMGDDVYQNNYGLRQR